MDAFGFLYMWNYDERQIPFFPSSYKPIYRYASKGATVHSESSTLVNC